MALFVFILKHYMKVPFSLSFVKLKDYQKFCLIKNPTNVDLLKCILNISDNDLSKIKSSKVDKLILDLNKLFEDKPVFKTQFTIYGTTYGFIPKLDDISYGENKDITSYINDWGNMHKAMAVMFRPIKQKFTSQYLIEDYEGSHVHAEVMKDMPLDIAMGAMVFFYNLTNELLNCIPKYLETEIKEEQTKGVVSAENGEAIQNSIHYLKKILQDLKKSLNSPYINA
jgi:hypothetical protein|tara:strand:+ start:462 stop:1139 length:678 start_codon:yes stop_codon:yes gene_type:complete